MLKNRLSLLVRVGSVALPPTQGSLPPFIHHQLAYKKTSPLKMLNSFFSDLFSPPRQILPIKFIYEIAQMEGFNCPLPDTVYAQESITPDLLPTSHHSWELYSPHDSHSSVCCWILSLDYLSHNRSWENEHHAWHVLVAHFFSLNGWLVLKHINVSQFEHRFLCWWTPF